MDSTQEIQKLFGERVRFYRKLEGLTLKEIAERIGKTEASLSRIENGKQNLALGDIVTIAQALRVSVSKLFGDEDETEVATVPNAGELARFQAFKELCRLCPREKWEEIIGTMARFSEAIPNYSQLKFVDEYQYVLA